MGGCVYFCVFLGNLMMVLCSRGSWRGHIMWDFFSFANMAGDFSPVFSSTALPASIRYVAAAPTSINRQHYGGHLQSFIITIGLQYRLW